jgi:pimeloyl-ACP methyl ester carboxylesterase
MRLNRWPPVQVVCHWLVVPEAREKPNGRTVRLAVAVIRTATPAATPLVMLHGGPGGSGLRTYLPAARGDGVLARNL